MCAQSRASPAHLILNTKLRHTQQACTNMAPGPSASRVPPQRLPEWGSWRPDGTARLLQQPTSARHLRLAESLPATGPGLRPTARPVRPATAADVLPARPTAAPGPGHVPAAAAKERRWRWPVRRAVCRTGVLLLSRLLVLSRNEAMRHFMLEDRARSAAADLLRFNTVLDMARDLYVHRTIL
ncbi:hypothetical protein BDU57DRAFT_135923 [Ampelomyces quisqualis]|uniref:Uncharacterized protein n=1 Tax=Ampelomyces quisqualis TaxID=50730 RepID=A0A6A5QXC6_AMPQU|nr:hypothetical protein BDU57DRAFT_135923 [Ampelomyces quisqualis]